MEVYECVRARRTVRSYRPDPVPGAVVDKLLRAGRWAPSSRNSQPWHFIVVRNRETLRELGAIAASGEEGLGTCFVGLRDEDQNRRVRALLGVPDRMELVTLLPFGYREDAGKGRGKRRKPLSEIAHGERFGDPYGTG